MERTLYLFSLVTFIVGALLGSLVGARYILSPVAVFQLGSMLNFFLPIVFAILLTIVLGVRFFDVWKRKIDIEERATSKAARFAQFWGKLLIILFYLLFLMFLVSFLTAGPLQAEVVFLLSPLFKTLPVGLALFELGRLIEKDRACVSI